MDYSQKRLAKELVSFLMSVLEKRGEGTSCGREEGGKRTGEGNKEGRGRKRTRRQPVADDHQTSLYSISPLSMLRGSRVAVSE